MKRKCTYCNKEVHKDSYKEVKIIDIDNDIYRVNIKGVGVRGARPAIYKKIKRYLNKFLVYRTYDYKEVLIEDFLRDYSS